MAFFNWYDLPPNTCARCGEQQFDRYCHGEIVFDDGDTVPVCYDCAEEWFDCLVLDERGHSITGPDGHELVDPEKAAAFQRRGVESPRAQSLRESRERRAAAAGE